MGLELVTRSLRPGATEKVKGPPRFLGDPEVDVPRSQTPAGSRTPGHLRRRDAAFRPEHDVGSRECVDFGVQSRGPSTGCLRFAGRVAPAPRKTRFRPLAELCRAGVGTPQGPYERFPLYASSFPKLSWRTSGSTISEWH
jgi:hypothetical protein